MHFYYHICDVFAHVSLTFAVSDHIIRKELDIPNTYRNRSADVNDDRVSWADKSTRLKNSNSKPFSYCVYSDYNSWYFCNKGVRMNDECSVSRVNVKSTEITSS